MLIPIPSYRKRFTIHLSIRALEDVWLGIHVYDPVRYYSNYFKRKAFIPKGVLRSISIMLPVTPDQLELELLNKQTRDYKGFKVERFDIKEMPQPSFWADPMQHRFMDFAIKFAQKAGHLPAGFYDSKSHEFLFQYLPKIVGSDGSELITPARTHRKMPRVQISRKLFRQFSIPVRVAILAHEGCHYLLNTRSEKEADLCGMNYYLSYGFPKIEAVYAATKVFGMHPETIGNAHLKRTQDVINYIQQFKKSKGLKL